MKINNYFTVQEFLDPNAYAKLMKEPEDKRLKAFYSLVDKRLINTLTFIREKTKCPIIVNNWHREGNFKWRGLRTPECTIGAPLSAHRLGKAVDFNVKCMTDAEVKKFVIDNQKELYKLGIRRMESAQYAPTWCHLDLITKRGWKDKIYVFNP